MSVDEANDLYADITKADLDAQQKNTSAAQRAEAYRNLDSAALLPKANAGDDAAMKRLSDRYARKKTVPTLCNGRSKPRSEATPSCRTIWAGTTTTARM